MSEHTSETWEVFQSATNDFGIIVMREGKPVFVVDPGNIRKDDAERAVRVHNCHELLLAACDEMLADCAQHNYLPRGSVKYRQVIKLAGAA